MAQSSDNPAAPFYSAYGYSSGPGAAAGLMGMTGAGSGFSSSAETLMFSRWRLPKRSMPIAHNFGYGLIWFKRRDFRNRSHSKFSLNAEIEAEMESGFNGVPSGFAKIRSKSAR